MFSTAQEMNYLKITAYKEGEVLYQRNLDQSQLIVGRAPNCDILINDPSVSYYHAIINLAGPDSGKIIDLDTINGTFINGDKKEEIFFSLGDVIRFGSVDFYIEETHIEDDIEDVNQETSIIDVTTFREHFVEKRPVEGLSIIDGEYCDIKFDEPELERLDIPVYEYKYDYSDFIDTEVAPENDLGIQKDSSGDSIEVTTLSNGNIISTRYLPLKNRTYTLGDSKKRNNIRLEIFEDTLFPFIAIKNGNITIHKIDQFKAYNLANIQNPIFSDDSVHSLEEGENLLFTYNSVQLLIKIVPKPPALKFAPFFGRDRKFQMHLFKVTGLLFACVLSLLLVDVTTLKEEDVEETPVIYKKVVKAPIPSEQPTSEKISDDKPPGQKEEKQPEKEVAKAKEGEPKPEPKKEKKVPQNKKLEKVAEVKKTEEKKEQRPKKPKIKAYNFKFENSLSAITNNTNTPKKVTVNKADAQLAVNTGLTNSLNKSSEIKTQSTTKIGNLGSDRDGFKNKSYGTYGLSSKKGVDTAYVEPETVVLGSIDPEVLRKILQEYLPQFRHCYQKELQVNEQVKGIIDLQFTIGHDGKVTKSQVLAKRSRFTKRGTNCMKQVLGVIQFPKPKGGGQVDVRQPLNFFSENQKI